MITHIDERRELFEFFGLDYDSVKVLVFKKTATVGNHSHDDKDEYFLLASGKILYLQNGDLYWDSGVPTTFCITAGSHHVIKCTKGSVLVCASKKVEMK
jgi:quercetin dioxygenase-like cupin family protein